jgi:hypothetical protein
MDRLEATQAALCAALADPALTPVQAAPAVLDQELGAMTGWLAAQQDASQAREAIRRFSNLIRATPALRAYQADMTDQSASAPPGSWPRGREQPRTIPSRRSPPAHCSGCGPCRPTACAGTWTARPPRHCSTSASPPTSAAPSQLIDTGLRAFAVPA